MQELKFTVEERDAEELVLVLQGYFKLFTSNDLPVHSDPDDWIIDTGMYYFVFLFIVVNLSLQFPYLRIRHLNILRILQMKSKQRRINCSLIVDSDIVL